MTRSRLLQFLRSHSLAVQASVTPSGSPQAAVVGFVVTDDFEVFFDTLSTSRKAHNLRQNARIALAIGGWNPGDERTVQYEGIADEPSGPELDRLKELYFGTFPDGRERLSWPGLIYVRARPIWIRYSDFTKTPPRILEFTLEQLKQLES
jgi:Pyridoxamine 5'-phosphate oxidase